MIRLHILRDKSSTEAVEYMKQYSWRPPVGFHILPDLEIQKGDVIKLPKLESGKVAAIRRHVFLFWRKEYLIRFTSHMGDFYVWKAENKIEWAGNEAQ